MQKVDFRVRIVKFYSFVVLPSSLNELWQTSSSRRLIKMVTLVHIPYPPDQRIGFYR
jgi:hypothetical protein